MMVATSGIDWTNWHKMLIVFLLIFGTLASCLSGHDSNSLKSKSHTSAIYERPASFTEQLVDHLKSGYNPEVRPTYNANISTIVHMKFFVSQVLDLDEILQTLKTNSWITLIWKDEFMVWNASDFGGLQYIQLPASLLWLPQVTLYDNVRGDDGGFLAGQIVKLYSDGTVLWAAPVIFHSVCQIEVEHFPFDVQECPLKFGPWQYTAREITLGGEGSASAFTSSGEWDLIGMTTTNNTSYYPDEVNVPYCDVVFTVILSRRPLFYIVNIFLPSSVLIGATSLVFFLPAESGEKLSFGITIMLSTTVFLMVLTESMPRNGFLSIIGQFYSITIVLVLLSTIISVTVVNIHHRGNFHSRISPWVRKWVLCRLGAIFGLRKLLDEDGAKSNDAEKSRLAGSSISPVFIRKKIDNTETVHTANISRIPEIYREIKCLREFQEKREKDRRIQLEWSVVAKIVDRCFAVLYLLCIMVAIAAILMNEKYQGEH